LNPPAATDAPRPQVAQGLALLREGRVGDALGLAEQLARQWPAHAEVQFLACEARDANGDAAGALRAIEAALLAAPAEIPLQLRQIELLIAQRRRREACAAAAALEPRLRHDPRGLRAIGQFHSRCDDPVGAARYFAQALALAPGHPGLLYDLAATQFFAGDFDAAERALDASIERAPDTGHALYLRSTLRAQTVDANHVDALRRQLRTGLRDPVARAAALYALAKELEDLGRDSESFDALREGAATKRSTLRYDVAAERAAMQSIASAYTAEAIAKIRPGPDRSGPIFVVGMPRTGTTLVERMLGRAPGVRPVGELPDFGQALAAAVRARGAADSDESPAQQSLSLDFSALAADYLRGALEVAGGGSHCIDKMPINFLYCGPILLAMPGARIVHLVRDPMDTCYAVFKTLFHQAYHFSYDQHELADYYIAYRRLMRHWQTVFPGRIVDVRYEELVTDTPAQARRLLQACGLEWRDEVLAPDRNAAPSTTASAAQVRQPVHARSIRKWRRHAAGLEPLRRRLEQAGLVDSDGAALEQ
jgi:tetratricopeptide (TPR) repeat protein